MRPDKTENHENGMENYVYTVIYIQCILALTYGVYPSLFTYFLEAWVRMK